MTEWHEDGHDELGLDQRRWPMTPTDLLPRERWLWWQQLWSDVNMLGERYRVRPGKDWWEDGTHVEALAAVAAWVERYDCGEWDDPPGKLALLYDLERVRELIRGTEPFHPDRDRGAFVLFLIDAGCQPPPGSDPDAPPQRQ
jgi:hypothetical protein